MGSQIYPYGEYTRKVIKRIKILSLCLAIIAAIAYVYSGNSVHLMSWGLVTLGLLLFPQLFKNNEMFSSPIYAIVIFSYMLFSLVGILSICSYFQTYGFAFAPYDDDSYYFMNIESIVGGQLPNSFTLYEVFMAFVYFLLSFFKESITVQDLLPFNWALGAIAVGLASLLAYRVSDKLSVLASASLLINYNFVDAVVHLYRDGLVLVFTLLCILFALRKRYVISIIFALLTGLNRGGNGLLCIIYVMFFILCHVGGFNKLNIKAIMVCILVVTGFLATDNFFKMGGLGRSFMKNSSIEKQSIFSRAKSRTNHFLGRDHDGYNSIKLLYSLGPLGKVVIPFASLFNPVRWKGFRVVTKVRIRGYYIGFRSVFRPVMGFMLVTIISWVIIGPRLVQGLYFGIKNSDDVFILSLLFVITLFAISLVSFQARHRTAFEIFFPCFIALAVCKTRSERSRRIWLSLFFVVLIIIVNVLPYLL